MAQHPNQGGGNNRQGPKVTKGGGTRGPIVGKMSGAYSGTQRPFTVRDGKNGSTKGKHTPGSPQK